MAALKPFKDNCVSYFLQVQCLGEGGSVPGGGGPRGFSAYCKAFDV